MKGRRLIKRGSSLFWAANLLSISTMTFAQGITDDSPKALEFTLITGDKVSAMATPNRGLFGARLVSDEGQEQITSLQQLGSDIYLIPPKAAELVDKGLLDRELFNLTKLYKAGFDDESMANLPIIIEYRDGNLPATNANLKIPGAKLTARFDIIDSLAMSVSKSELQDLLANLDYASSIQGVWLDASVEAHEAFESRRNKHWWSHSIAKDDSYPTVPLTGAYGNYAAPYKGNGVKVAVLDTGYDTDHPDLAGQVVASQSFVWPYTEVDDINGHGTHTASTVAGNGFASNGKYAGMAPKAELLIAKVLGDNGSGSTSGIMQAMEWAVDNGADIINMSLGSSGTSCDGPMVDLVEALSDKALFVISAGNSFTRETIGIPGCAPSALTVAAVDRGNETANFSSRGPSPDGHSLKPDIASQGVNVIAAASGGKGDHAYRSLSGTSMAAPHVAGGAAILLEARPDLSPRQLKSVLTSSVTATQADVLEQGAGAMDVNAAIKQVLVANPGQELGMFTYGETQTAVQSLVALENLSDEDLTLKLKLEFTGEDGKSAIPSNAIWLDAQQVTIPAKSVAQVPVWINPSVELNDSAYGTIGGRLIGESMGKDKAGLTVPLSYWITPPLVDLTVNLFDRYGKPASYPSKFYIMNGEDAWVGNVNLQNGSRTISVPKGDYSLVSYIMTYDHQGNYGGLVQSVTMMAELSTKLTQNTVIDFNASEASLVEFAANKPLMSQGYSAGFTYGLNDDHLLKAGSVEIAPDYVTQVYALSRGRDDRFNSFITTRALAPKTTLTTGKGTEVDYTIQSVSKNFHGEGSAEVVVIQDQGYQTNWDDYEIQGKVVLLEFPYFFSSSSIKELANRGAVGVIGARPNSPGRFKYSTYSIDSIPTVGLDAHTSAVLLAEAEQGPMMIHWSGVAPERSPYAYNLRNISQGKIETGKLHFEPASLDQGQSDGVNGKRKLAQRTAHYHSQGDTRPVWTDMHSHVRGLNPFYAGGTPLALIAPLTRTEYYSTGIDGAWTDIVMPRFNVYTSGALFEGARYYSRGAKNDVSWFKASKGAALLSSGSALGYRDTNLLEISLPHFGDSFGHDGVAGRDASAFGLTLVNGQPTNTKGGFIELPDEDARVTLIRTYQMRQVESGSSSNEKLGTEYLGSFSWNTNSELQGAQPVLVPAIDLPVDMENTIAANQPIQARVSAKVDLRNEVSLSQVSVRYAIGQECRVETYVYKCTSMAETQNRWQDANVMQQDGQWFVNLPNNGEAGDYVHLQITVQDNLGGESEVTTMRAYLLD
ncbi:peptidase S8 [Shewanella marisflavi]|uniref:Peptidase S8 n=2 Tax=Shewanella marisflavi TaxID=260364 RepID=A0AAC9U0X3_9GAMM|nr:peptidase S8 [Shewanella marisflavi]